MKRVEKLLDAGSAEHSEAAIISAGRMRTFSSVGSLACPQPMTSPISPYDGEPPTGEPDAGRPPVRFGGRGERNGSPYPYTPRPPRGQRGSYASKLTLAGYRQA